MDALPMEEESDAPFRSQVKGAAHACGHDAHTAMLVGAARLLARRRGEIAGRVLFMFQPGEEGHDGAKRMLDEGLLEPSFAGDVTRAFAIHQAPMFPSRTIATRPGTMMASVDGFRVTVHGRGGHASMPHAALDPIPVACEIVLALQTFITRRVDVFDPAVLTVGKVSAGTGRGIIPERAVVEGTFRAFTKATQSAVAGGIARVAEGIAAAHGLHASAEVLAGYPVTVNDPAAAEWVSAVAEKLVGAARTVRMPQPVPGSEDFSHVLERVPGALAILGTMPPGVKPSEVAPLHSPRMQLDEGALAVGVALYAAVALSGLTGASPR